MENKWPGIFNFWVRYYINFLGLGHFSIYDNDGSVEPYVQSLIMIKEGVLSYHKKSMEVLINNGSSYCAETLMENQCIWNSRGISEWAMLVHAPDNFLRPVGLDSDGLYKTLDSFRNLDMVRIPTYIYMSEKSENHLLSHKSAIKILQIKRRRCNLIARFRHLPLENPRKVHGLFVHTCLDPFCTSKSMLVTDLLSVNHYFTIYLVEIVILMAKKISFARMTLC